MVRTGGPRLSVPVDQLNRALAGRGPSSVDPVPRRLRASRLLVTPERAYLWRLRHTHDARDDAGRPTGCRETLTLNPQPAGTGGALRIVFAQSPGRFVPGGAPLGSGDVGYTHGASLNLHEPGAVRALLDAALADGWRPEDKRPVEVDGWPLLLAATARLPSD